MGELPPLCCRLFRKKGVDMVFSLDLPKGGAKAVAEQIMRPSGVEFGDRLRAAISSAILVNLDDDLRFPSGDA